MIIFFCLKRLIYINKSQSKEILVLDGGRLLTKHYPGLTVYDRALLRSIQMLSYKNYISSKSESLSEHTSSNSEITKSSDLDDS